MSTNIREIDQTKGIGIRAVVQTKGIGLFNAVHYVDQIEKEIIQKVFKSEWYI